MWHWFINVWKCLLRAEWRCFRREARLPVEQQQLEYLSAAVIFDGACTLLQESCQMAFYSYLRALCNEKKSEFPCFFSNKTAYRSLHSFTRLGSKPDSDQKAPLGLMLFVLRSQGFIKWLRLGWRLPQSSQFPQNEMTELQSDPQPRVPGRGSFLLNIYVNRGVLLILCHDSSLASKPGVAVLGPAVVLSGFCPNLSVRKTYPDIFL